jgi:putative transcriptional regulator
MKMTAGNAILEGLNEALAHARGEVDAIEHPVRIPDMIDVRAVREHLALSQAQFALKFGFKLDTVRNWEQAKRVPNASARALLKIIETEPEAVKRALAMG